MEMIDYDQLPHLITKEERMNAQERGKRIIELSNEGWMQKDIAPEVGVDPSVVSRFLRRVRDEQEAKAELEAHAPQDDEVVEEQRAVNEQYEGINDAYDDQEESVDDN